MGILDNLGPFKGLFSQVEEAALPGLISDGLAKTGLGDLQGLVDNLQQGGLGAQVHSWLGDGPNMSIDPSRHRWTKRASRAPSDPDHNPPASLDTDGFPVFRLHRRQVLHRTDSALQRVRA